MFATKIQFVCSLFFRVLVSLLQSISLSSVGGGGSRWAKSSSIFVGVRACQTIKLPNCQIKLVHNTVPVMTDVHIVKGKRKIGVALQCG